MIAVVVIERVVLLREVGHEQAEAAVVVVAPTATPMLPCSAPSWLTATPIGNADLLERAVLLVRVQEVRRRIVGHVQIRPAVVVEVEPGDAESEIAVGIADAGLRRPR